MLLFIEPQGIKYELNQSQPTRHSAFIFSVLFKALLSVFPLIMYFVMMFGKTSSLTILIGFVKLIKAQFSNSEKYLKWISFDGNVCFYFRGAGTKPRGFHDPLCSHWVISCRVRLKCNNWGGNAFSKVLSKCEHSYSRRRKKTNESETILSPN